MSVIVLPEWRGRPQIEAIGDLWSSKIVGGSLFPLHSLSDGDTTAEHIRIYKDALATSTMVASGEKIAGITLPPGDHNPGIGEGHTPLPSRGRTTVIVHETSDRVILFHEILHGLTLSTWLGKENWEARRQVFNGEVLAQAWRNFAGSRWYDTGAIELEYIQAENETDRLCYGEELDVSSVLLALAEDLELTPHEISGELWYLHRNLSYFEPNARRRLERSLALGAPKEVLGRLEKTVSDIVTFKNRLAQQQSALRHLYFHTIE
jgi:hypothetical protein